MSESNQSNASDFYPPDTDDENIVPFSTLGLTDADGCEYVEYKAYNELQHYAAGLLEYKQRANEHGWARQNLAKENERLRAALRGLMTDCRGCEGSCMCGNGWDAAEALEET